MSKSLIPFHATLTHKYFAAVAYAIQKYDPVSCYDMSLLVRLYLSGSLTEGCLDLEKISLTL